MSLRIKLLRLLKEFVQWSRPIRYLLFCSVRSRVVLSLLTLQRGVSKVRSLLRFQKDSRNFDKKKTVGTTHFITESGFFRTSIKFSGLQKKTSRLPRLLDGLQYTLFEFNKVSSNMCVILKETPVTRRPLGGPL